MPKRSLFFCVALAGATCDGRTISDQDLQDMAETYAPATYQARMNCEHLRGLLPNGDFGAYGDVVALETRDVDIELGGKTEKKLGLFAQVDALDNLLAVQAKGQKLFSSIEINPNFAGTGKAYLQGLAITDSPASLGTEIMQFAAQQVADGKPSPFADRKIDKANFFSASHEISGLQFSETTPATGGDAASALLGEATGFFAGMRKFFAGEGEAPAPKTGTSPAPANAAELAAAGAGGAPPAAGAEQPATGEVAKLGAMMAEGLDKLAGVITAQGQSFDTKLTALESKHEELASTIENTPAGGGGKRPPATGQPANYVATDC